MLYFTNEFPIAASEMGRATSQGSTEPGVRAPLEDAGLAGHGTATDQVAEQTAYVPDDSPACDSRHRPKSNRTI